MNPVERDAYLISQAKIFESQGMSARQAVLEVIRTAGFFYIALPTYDQAAIQTDVDKVKSADNPGT
jgi:hypothetical protein